MPNGETPPPKANRESGLEEPVPYLADGTVWLKSVKGAAIKTVQTKAAQTKTTNRFMKSASRQNEAGSLT
jgi:hypothetical protein